MHKYPASDGTAPRPEAFGGLLTTAGGLLFAGGVFIAPDLLGAGGICGAAIDRGKLRFQPQAGRVASRRARRSREILRRRRQPRGYEQQRRVEAEIKFSHRDVHQQ